MRQGCPMRVKIIPEDRGRADSEWLTVYTQDGSELHNHRSARDVSVYPAHRGRDAASMQGNIVTMRDLETVQSAACVSIGQAHATLVIANPDSLTIPKDIANARSAARRSALATQTPMEALFTKLWEHGFWFKYAVDATSRELVRLFWAHPATIQMYKTHPDVLVMDCTYKTNAHDMPLLNIVSMTGFNTVLPVAQCWMPGEKEEDYRWALTTLRELMQQHNIPDPHTVLTDRDLACMNAVDAVFAGIPAMICRWHMNQNVLAKTRSRLGQIENLSNVGPRFINSPATDRFMALYYDALDVRTEEEFDARCTALRRADPVLGAYLDAHWWKYKTRVVRVWTDSYHHFGYQDTSPVEGTHAKIKRWLASSKGDLYTVFLKLLPRWSGVSRNLSYITERDATIVPFCLQHPRYSRVNRVITRWALNKTHDLWRDATRIVKNRVARSTCAGAFRRINGRQCVHEVTAMIERGEVLEKIHFNRHWWIPGAEEYTAERVFVPALSRKRRKKKSTTTNHQANRGAGSTARDPTLAERVDMNHPAQPPSAPGLFDGPPLPILFFETNLPARTWGYAGRREYPSQHNGTA